MSFVRAARVAELPAGALAQVRVGGRELALANVDGVIQALEGRCPHRNGPLGQGNLADGNVICPWHGWEFAAASGVCTHNPACTLARYAVEVRGEEIWVDAGAA